MIIVLISKTTLHYLAIKKICFKDTDTEITALIAEMKNPKSIKSCIKTTDPKLRCILKNSSHNQELKWAISLQTYINKS